MFYSFQLCQTVQSAAPNGHQNKLSLSKPLLLLLLSFRRSSTLQNFGRHAHVTPQYARGVRPIGSTAFTNQKLLRD